jgi:hypothetical protein
VCVCNSDLLSVVTRSVLKCPTSIHFIHVTMVPEVGLDCPDKLEGLHAKMNRNHEEMKASYDERRQGWKSRCMPG